MPYDPEKTAFLLAQPRQTALESLLCEQLRAAERELARAQTAAWHAETGAREAVMARASLEERRRRVGLPQEHQITELP
jgi:hypothetical protein